MKKVASLILMSCTGMARLMAQAPNESTDFMRSIGKINVVVAVIVAIFLGIVLFLVFLERKMSRLETQINED